MKSLEQLITDLGNRSTALKKLADNLPRISGVEFVRIIRQNFNAGGYDSGQGMTKWKERSPATNKAYEYNRPKYWMKKGKKGKHPYKGLDRSYKGGKTESILPKKNPYKGSVYSAKNKVLWQTGNLMDAVTYKVGGKTVTTGVFSGAALKGGIQTEAIKYAKIHNEGGVGKWGKNKIKIPQRQYMPRPPQGPNAKMLKAVYNKVNRDVTEIMNEWKK